MSDAAKRKSPQRPEPRATHSRPVEGTTAAPRSAYASVLAHARAAGLCALTVIVPLGVLAGTVSACGAAPPARPAPYNTMVPASSASGAEVAPPTGAGTQPAPLQPIPAPAPSQPLPQNE